jgi:hypothetical protein
MKYLKSGNLRPLVILVVSLFQGCIVALPSGYQVPNALAEDEVRFGAAGGYVNVKRNDPASNEEIDFGQVDAWVDIGLGNRGELRIHLVLLPEITTGEYADTRYLPGFALEGKFANQSENMALLIGLSFMQIITDHYEEWKGTEFNMFLLSPYIGGVFALGEPGRPRLVAVPRFASFWPYFQLSLAVGFELPLTRRISIRPEGHVSCAFQWSHMSHVSFIGGFGLAVVF